MDVYWLCKQSSTLTSCVCVCVCELLEFTLTVVNYDARRVFM